MVTTQQKLSIANIDGLDNSKMQKLQTLASQIGKISFNPDGNPNPLWHVHSARTMGKAEDLSTNAVRDESRRNNFKIKRHHEIFHEIFISTIDLAEKNGRKGILITARNEIREITKKAISGALREKSGRGSISHSVLSSVVEVAESMAALIIVEDLEFKNKAEYIAYTSAVMEILQKGYGFGGHVGDDISDPANIPFYVYYPDNENADASQLTGKRKHGKYETKSTVETRLEQAQEMLRRNGVQDTSGAAVAELLRQLYEEDRKA